MQLTAVIWWLLTLFALAPSAAWAEKRVALIIGNGSYPMAPLRNPINDARAMARTLGDLGFEVTLRTNLNQRGMIEALRDFGSSLGRDGEAVFYYSGHGMQVRGRNYLIPVDADIRSEDEVPYMSLDVAQVLDKMEVARSRANIVILDACRNNPFIRAFRSARVGLAQMDAPVGTLLAFATAPGSEARDGEGEFGVYTRHLLEHVRTPGLLAELVFRRVREGVTAETKDRQIPWESSSLKGDFYFNSSAAVSTPQAPAIALPAPSTSPSVDAMTVELAFWNSIKDSRNTADFDAYLSRYPDGAFAALARNRIDAATAQARSASRSPVVDTPSLPQRGEPATSSRVAEGPTVALRAPGATAAHSGRRAPGIGDSWTYQLVDRRHDAVQATITHQIVAIDAEGITEKVTRKGKTQPTSEEHLTLGARALERQLAGSHLVEFAPYLAAETDLQVGKSWNDVPGLGQISEFDRWRVEAKIVSRERIKVPAGEFEAYKVELEASRPSVTSPNVTYVTRLSLTAWYAAAIGRVVSTQRRTFEMRGRVIDDDRYELVSFRLR